MSYVEGQGGNLAVGSLETVEITLMQINIAAIPGPLLELIPVVSFVGWPDTPVGWMRHANKLWMVWIDGNRFVRSDITQIREMQVTSRGIPRYIGEDSNGPRFRTEAVRLLYLQ